MNITIELLKNTLSKKGYKWFTDRPNLIGIRSTLDVPDSFNDFFCLVYQIPQMPSLSLIDTQKFLNMYGFKGANGKSLSEDGVAGKNTSFALEQYNAVVGKEVLKIYPITTNPGVYWLNHPMNKLGAAVLKPGQWVDCWQLGFHNGKSDHKALVQTGGKIKVYRDNNKDNNYQLDESRLDSGFFGVNIHGSSKTGKSVIIGKWSAGCQVFSTWAHKEEVMSICEIFKKSTNNKFTYTLIDEKDLF